MEWHCVLLLLLKMSNWSHQHGAGIKHGSQQDQTLTDNLMYIKYVPNWGFLLNLREHLNRLLSARATCSLTLYFTHFLLSSMQETMQDPFILFLFLFQHPALRFGNPELSITVSSYVLTLSLIVYPYSLYIKWRYKKWTMKVLPFARNIGFWW